MCRDLMACAQAGSGKTVSMQGGRWVETSWPVHRLAQGRQWVCRGKVCRDLMACAQTGSHLVRCREA